MPSPVLAFMGGKGTPATRGDIVFRVSTPLYICILQDEVLYLRTRATIVGSTNIELKTDGRLAPSFRGFADIVLPFAPGLT